MQHDILNTEVTTIDGEKTTLASFAGKVLLIVNVASKCGLTPQYEQLEDLQKQFGSAIDKKKIVLESEIKAFGRYTAEIKLYTGISAKMGVEVGE